MSSTDQPILLTYSDGSAWLSIHRPGRRNAADMPTHRALQEAISEIEGEPSVRAMIHTGMGTTFCAMQDLGERSAQLHRGGVDLQASFKEGHNSLIGRLAEVPILGVAMVKGNAAGAGASLALGRDIVLTAQSACFRFGFVSVACGPDSGASWMLLHRSVGTRRAMALRLGGESIDAAEAASMGLGWKRLPDPSLLPHAERIARRFADGPRMSIAAIKRQVSARRRISALAGNARSRRRDAGCPRTARRLCQSGQRLHDETLYRFRSRRVEFCSAVSPRPQATRSQPVAPTAAPPTCSTFGEVTRLTRMTVQGKC